MVQALEGLKVLDLTRYAPGPYCTMILGDLGADIVRVEEVGPPGGRRAEQMQGMDSVPPPEEFASPETPYNPLNRNKRSIRLNLKAPEGQRIFYRLAEEADVVVEGFRPGVTARLGVDYPVLKEINPRLIYCSITGYGQDGPYSQLPGHDINYIASAGVMNAIGLAGSRPPVPGNIIGDMAGGGMQAAIGVLAALAAREKTGRGQFVDISMTDGAVSLISLYLSRFFQHGTLPGPGDKVSCGEAHYYGSYKTGDGKLLCIGCSEPWFFANLCRALGCEEFIPHQLDPGKADEIRAFFERAFLSRTRDEWFEILSKAEVAVSKVYALDELAGDPQLMHRRMIIEVDSPLGRIRQAGISIKLSDTPGKIRHPGSGPGEDTAEILAELGYGPEQVGQLLADNVIGQG